MRRAKNSLAVSLAERYLRLFACQGVELPVPFRLETQTVGDRTWTLFVDSDAPTMTGQETVNDDGDPVVVFLPAGESPLAGRTKGGSNKPASEQTQAASPEVESATP